MWVAQAQQGQAHLDAVAIGQALRGGIDIEVGRHIFAVPGGDVHTVGNHAGRIDAHELRRAAVAHRVDQHRDEVLVAPDLIAPHQRRTNLGRVWIEGADADHQRIGFGHDLQCGAVARRWRLAIERQELHEGVVQWCGLPCRIVEAAIELDALTHGERDRTRLRQGDAEGKGRQQHRHGKEPGRSPGFHSRFPSRGCAGGGARAAW